MLAGLLRAEGGLPERLAVPIEGEERVLPIDRRGDVDRLVPDDGRGAALAGERRLPEPAGVGVELHRVGARVGAAVIAGAAPTGPVAVGGEGGGSAEVSRQGVQRDLLPLVEGTTVSTKYGMVKTDHILFIASGAFHLAKPSDLVPELQGRLPIRVELQALTRDDMRRILTEPEASLIKQYVALMKTEGVTLDITDGAIDALADVAVAVNSTVENIGARRLQTVMERVLDEISFTAPDRHGETIQVDADYVTKHVGDLAKNADLSRFIL